jgi:hypothetical protein
MTVFIRASLFRSKLIKIQLFQIVINILQLDAPRYIKNAQNLEATHIMKALSSLFVLGMVVGLSAQNAHAKKLDLNSIQGKYDVVIKPMMSLGCPDTITVVYDAKNATLDSEAFHFSNIDGKTQDGGIDFDKDHASYESRETSTSVHKDSITEDKLSNTTTSDTSNLILADGPMDNAGPGSAESMGLEDTSDEMRTEVKFDSKKNTLTKTVNIGSMNLGEDCTFVRSQ